MSAIQCQMSVLFLAAAGASQSAPPTPWLPDFLARVPADACAVVAANAPPAELLQRLAVAMGVPADPAIVARAAAALEPRGAAAVRWLPAVNASDTAAARPHLEVVAWLWPLAEADVAPVQQLLRGWFPHSRRRSSGEIVCGNSELLVQAAVAAAPLASAFASSQRRAAMAAPHPGEFAVLADAARLDALLAEWEPTHGADARSGDHPLAIAAMRQLLRLASRAAEEPQSGDAWLQPFLQLVPQTASAAAALRVPAGDFLERMYDALGSLDKELLNAAVRQVPWDGQKLNDARALIEKLKPALSSSIGLVFRRNDPDSEIPVINLAPVPQVAWVLPLQPGSGPIVKKTINWLRTNAKGLGFEKVYVLKLNLGDAAGANGNDGGEDGVWEFLNRQIEGTGEIAVMLYRDVLFVANSAPLLRDMLRAHNHMNGRQSMLDADGMQVTAATLPVAVNGFALLSGLPFGRLLDAFCDHAKEVAGEPDPAWVEPLRGLLRGVDAVHVQMELGTSLLRWQGKVVASSR